MIDEGLRATIVRELFALKRECGGGSRVLIFDKVNEAQRFMKKFSYEKVETFSVDDRTIIDEARRQIKDGKAVVIVANLDKQEYALYQTYW